MSNLPLGNFQQKFPPPSPSPPTGFGKPLGWIVLLVGVPAALSSGEPAALIIPVVIGLALIH